MPLSVEDYDWSNLLCNRRCMRLADGLYDGEPLCIQCAEEQIEYDAARAMTPSIINGLLDPSIRD